MPVVNRHDNGALFDLNRGNRAACPLRSPQREADQLLSAAARFANPDE